MFLLLNNKIAFQDSYHQRESCSLKVYLKRVFSRTSLKGFPSAVKEAFIVDEAAQFFNIEKQNILEIFAKQIGVEVAKPLTCPTQALIKNTGISKEEFERSFAIPQVIPGNFFGYSIAFASPKNLSIAEFLEKGVKCNLASGREIEAQWKEYDKSISTNIFPEFNKSIEELLLPLAESILKIGAEEVYLGYPDEGSYECHVNGKRFIGKIEEGLFSKIINKVYDEGDILVKQNRRHLKISLSRAVHRDILFLKWTNIKDNFENTSIDVETTSYSNQLSTFNSTPYNSPPYNPPPYKTPPYTNAVDTENTVSTDLEALDKLNRDIKDIEYIKHKSQELSPNHFSTTNNISNRLTSNVDISFEQIQSSINPRINANKILMIDDDPIFLEILKLLVASKGLEIQAVSSAATALIDLKSATEYPGVIISDLHMPGMFALDFLKELKKDRINLPVIVLTSDEEEISEISVIKAGACAYIKKSQNPELLMAWISNISKSHVE